VYQKIAANKTKLVARMKKDGLDKEDIDSIIESGIRNEDGFYKEGVWAKISNEQAMSYINDLYKGV
jgi:hypothetical protein